MVRYTLFFIFFFTVFSDVFSQHVDLNLGSNPTNVVRLGDSLAFNVQIYNRNTGVNQVGSYLDIQVPDGWKMVRTKPINAVARGSNKYRITGINLPVTQTIDFVVYLQPLCNAVSGEDIVAYTYHSSTNAQLATASTSPVANFQDPILSIIPPASVSANVGQQVTRNWSVSQTGTNSYVKGLKIEISCDTSVIKYHNIQFKNYLGVYTSIDQSLFTKESGKYTLYINEAIIRQIGNRDYKFDKDEILELREVVSNNNCNKSGNMTYQVNYGDMVEWCAAGSNLNSIVIPVPEFTPDIYFGNVRGKDIIPPFSSTGTSLATGRGLKIYKVSNNAANTASVMRDMKIDASIWDSYIDAENRAYMKVYRAYFVDENGQKISGTPDIPVNNDGVPGVTFNSKRKPYHYIISLDQLPAIDLSSYLPLIDADGDGRYNDLPPGESFSIGFEFDVQYQHVPDFTSHSFILFYRQVGDLYYKNTCNEYVKHINSHGGAGSTNIGDLSLGVNTPTISVLDQLNLRPGDKASLYVEVPAWTGATTRTGYTGDRPFNTYKTVHKIYLQLPEGLTYDSGKTMYISNLSTNHQQYIVDPQYITYNPATRMLEINNRQVINGSNLYVNMGIEATNVPATTKEAEIAFSFNFEGEPAKVYAKFTVPVDFNQILPCSTIELAKFASERSTFGYTDATMQNRANKNTPGVNLNAAGPYDNVSHLAYLSINSDINLGTDSLKLRLSYTSDQTAPYFIFPDNGNAVAIHYKPNSGANFTTVTSVDADHVVVNNTIDLHEMIVDITSFVNNGITLNQGDSIIVEFLTQTTENIPTTLTTVSELQMEVFTKNGLNSDCSPLLTDFKIFNYKIMSSAGLNGSYYGNEWGKTGNVSVNQLGNGSSGVNEIFTNEFRPNTLFRDMVSEYNGLFEVNNLYVLATSVNVPNSSFGARDTLKYPEEYGIRYENGKTYITIYSPSPLIGDRVVEAFSGYTSGIRYGMDFHYITGRDSVVSVNMKKINYPTSENPVEVNYSYNAKVTSYDWFFYEYSLSSVNANATPLGAYAEWNLTITNNSRWVNNDPDLPHSWLAFDCGPTVLDSVWLYDETGTTRLGEFDKVDNGKYWIKLKTNGRDTLEVAGSKTFKVKATYKVCDSTADIKAIYGMSNILYPDDPWTGYMSQHNTPRVFRTVGVDLTLTPSDMNFTTSIVDNISQISPGRYAFCQPFIVEASFHNGMISEIVNPKIRIRLPNGLQFDETYTPQLKVGNGSYVNFGGTLNVVTGYYADILLPDDYSIIGIGLDPSNPEPNANITVRFQLKPMCGFIDNSVYMEMSGEKGCGTVVTKQVSTVPIRIGDNTIPEVSIPSATINGNEAKNGVSSLTYTDAADGLLTLQVNYNWEYYQSDIMYAYIDLPKNLNFVDGKLKNPDSTYVVNFVYESQADTTINRYKALFNNPPAFPTGGLNYEAVLRLQVVNPATWDCDVNTFTVWSAITSNMECEGQHCDIFNVTSTADISFELLKYKLDFVDLSAIGVYKSATEETVTITGYLKNNSAVRCDSAFVELYLNNDGSGLINDNNTPLPGATRFWVKNIPGQDSVAFTVNADVNIDNICKLMLILRKSENLYICNDVSHWLSTVGYHLAHNSVDVCHGETISIGDLPQTGVSYSWSPSDYLNDAFSAQPEFSLPLTEVAPSAHKYTIAINRKGGCVATDTVQVNVQTFPVVPATTGDKFVCVGKIITLSNAVPGGEWSSSDTSVAIVNKSSATAGMVAGISEGEADIYYEVGNLCKTKVSFSVGVLPLTNPNILIGIEE